MMTLELTVRGPVQFLPEPSIVGVEVDPPPWGEQDGWTHVVWNGDDYLCVLEPELVGAL